MKNGDFKKMFLLFSHTLTENQRQNALDDLGVDTFVEMPGNIRKIWSQIPADADRIAPLLMPVQNWLIKESRAGDLVLIQGDFGATCLMVQFSINHGLVPVYSATQRKAKERYNLDGSVQTTHVFKHRRFRMYGR